MPRTFITYDPDQPFLLPPDLRDWLPQGHLALFISDVVDSLDLSKLLVSYQHSTDRGRPPYHPAMMLKLMVYGYSTGKRSSRKLERATYEEIPYRVLTANQHPDHASIAEFRRRHLDVTRELFVQVLLLCEKAGLVKLGHVSLDGSKVKANASKHKAMSYRRMCETEERLQREVEQLLAAAAAADEREDGEPGVGEELPEELRRREGRLVKIREAKAVLEQEARDKAAARKLAREAEEQATGRKRRGRKPKGGDPGAATPDDKAQRNFTDPDSRIMKDGASKAFEQAYNTQIVVDDRSQVIVAADVTQEANDKQQLVPMLESVRTNLGRLPRKASADTGYFSEDAVTATALKDVDLYVATERHRHGVESEAPPEQPSENPSVKERMRAKLRAAEGRAVYARRKAIVEPVFGQLKEVQEFRRFLLRSLEKVTAEWFIACLCHNLLKLFRMPRYEAPA
jgi:transposase